MSDRSVRARRPNGAGSITTRPDGAAIIRVTDAAGVRHKRIVPRAVRDDGTGRPETAAQHRQRAERALVELRRHVARPSSLRERWTIERYARERYLPSVVEALKANTVCGYTAVLDSMVFPFIGRVELSKLSADHVDDLDRQLAARGYSLVSRRHARGAVGRVLRHAMRKGRVDRDVTSAADRLAVDDRDRTKNALEPAQVAAILTAAKGGDWEAPLALLALLGLRRGEMLGLSWQCVDLDRAELTVEHSLTTLPGRVFSLTAPKTPASRRTLGLIPPLVALLRQHKARQAERRLAVGEHWAGGSLTDDRGETVTLVFVDAAGRPLPGHTVNDALERIAHAAGVDARCTPHVLRHSAASMMLSEGADIASVASVLGHANAGITAAVYSHAIGRTRKRATGAISAAVGEW